MNVKGWYIFSLLFLLYNLKLLFDVKYLRSYCMRESNVLWGDKKYLACLDFDRLRDLDETDLEPKNQNASIEEFIHYCVLKIEKNLDGIRIPIKLLDKFIFKKHFCFNVNSDQEFSRQLTYFLKHNFKLFIYSNEKTPFFFQSIYNKEHLNPSLNHFHFRVLRQLVFEMERPFSNCVRYRRSYSKELPYDLFDCLNACLKEHDDSLFHLYEGIENLIDIVNEKRQKMFDLAYVFRKFRMLNRTELANVDLVALLDACQRECPGDGCVWESYATVTRHFDKEEIDQKEYVNFMEMAYEAYPSTSYFYLQLFGLISLFTGVSVSGSVPKLVEIAFRKLQPHRSKEFKNIFPRFTFALVVLCYLIYTVKVREMFNEYLNKTAYPNKSVIIDFSMKAEPFSLVICIPIEALMNGSDLNDAKCIPDHETVYGYNSSVDLDRMTFEQLESLTEPKPDAIVEKIVLAYAAKEFDAEWHISRRVIFRNGIYKVKKRVIHGLMRCFRVSFKFKHEMKFISIMTIAAFKIHLKVSTYAPYLLGKDEAFSSSVQMFNAEFSILKVSLRYSPDSLNANCTEYDREMVQSKVRCRGRGHCLDVCRVREYLKVHKRIPVNSVLKPAMFDGYLLKTYFSTKVDTRIEAICNENYSRQACQQEEFRTTLKNNFQYRKSIIEVDIYFEKTSIKEIEQSSIKVLLNVLNLVSILFGSNVFQVLIMSFSVVRMIFRIKWHQAYRFLFFLVCICGLCVNLYLIFNEIIISELVDSGFMRKLTWAQLPSLIFCLRFDEKLIDEHHLLNGEHLRRLTSGLTLASVFKRISFYNRTHFVDHQFSETADSPLSFSTFFYFNMKCFSITNSLRYYVKHLYFKNDSYVLRIYLNLELENPYRKIYVLYNSREKRQFNEAYSFRVGKVDNYTIDDASRKDFYRVTDQDMAYKYKATLERFDIVVEDKFQSLKRPQRLFCRQEDIFDQDTYLEKMKRRFTGLYGLTTKSIPLLENGFDFERCPINEPLFEQYYLQVQNYSDHYYPQNFNSLRTVYNFYTQTFIDNATGEPDFEFGVLFSARKILQTNEDNVATLVQNCFNSLSIWISLTILDMYILGF